MGHPARPGQAQDTLINDYPGDPRGHSDNHLDVQIVFEYPVKVAARPRKAACAVHLYIHQYHIRQVIALFVGEDVAWIVAIKLH